MREDDFRVYVVVGERSGSDLEKQKLMFYVFVSNMFKRKRDNNTIIILFKGAERNYVTRNPKQPSFLNRKKY